MQKRRGDEAQSMIPVLRDTETSVHTGREMDFCRGQANGRRARPETRSVIARRDDSSLWPAPSRSCPGVIPCKNRRNLGNFVARSSGYRCSPIRVNKPWPIGRERERQRDVKGRRTEHLAESEASRKKLIWNSLWIIGKKPCRRT